MPEKQKIGEAFVVEKNQVGKNFQKILLTD